MFTKKKRWLIIFIIVGIFFVINFKKNYAYSSEYIELNIPSSNGAYFNNLQLPAMSMPDPSIIKVNNTYYIYGTGGNGIMYTKSNDFKNWSNPQIIISKANSNQSGYWAPEIYYYKNKYYLYYTIHYPNNDGSTQCSPGVENNVLKNEIWVATSDSPDGPFTNAKKVNSKVKSIIDNFVLFDNNKVYMYSKKEVFCTGNPLVVEELDPNDITQVISEQPIELLRADSPLSEQEDLINNWERQFLEGPYVLKKNNKYYLMYSANVAHGDGYTIGYAVSSSPTGPFKKEVIGHQTEYQKSTHSLLHGWFSDGINYDSNKYIYRTGHNSILHVSDDEMYIIYHSAFFKNNEYISRKFNADYIGIDNNEKLFVNGPTIVDQPLPSGINDIYKVSNKDYDIIVNGAIKTTLNDNINYNVETTAFIMGNKPPITPSEITKTKSLTIRVKKEINIEDIWIFGTSSGFSNSTADIIINNKYILKKVNLSDKGSSKIQLPVIEDPILEIRIEFSKELDLSEINLYKKGNKYISYNNKLRSITLDGITVENFNMETTDYTKTFDYSKTSVEISAIANNDKATITGIGTKTLKVGTNTFTILVTSEAGTTNTYYLNITRKESQSTGSNVNTLKSLSIDKGNINFNSNTLTYNINVDSNVNKVKVNSTLTDSKSKYVAGYGNREISLKYGLNLIHVKVQAENGNIKTYTINITRKDNRNTVNTIKKLTISDIKFDFNPDILEYNIEVDSSNSTLEINSTLTDEKSKYIKDYGNRKIELKDGLNTFLIKVKAENGSIRTYTLNITRTISNNELLITKFKIRNYDLEFQSEKYEYSLLINNEKTLDITVGLSREDANYEILNNENLENGSIITIKASLNDNSQLKEYRINIIKNEIQEDILNEGNNSNNYIIPAILIGCGILSNTLVIIILKIRKHKNI